MKVEIIGGNLVITAKIDKNLPLSKSGKSKIIFTSGGNKATDVKYEGQLVVVGCTAYVKA